LRGLGQLRIAPARLIVRLNGPDRPALSLTEPP
jgi:hypothetical protein